MPPGSRDPSNTPLPGTQIWVPCCYCGREFQKLNVESFSIIICSHCGCPSYRGKANESQKILVDDRYKQFLAEKGEIHLLVEQAKKKTDSQLPSRQLRDAANSDGEPISSGGDGHSSSQDILAHIGKLNQEIARLKQEILGLKEELTELKEENRVIKEVLYRELKWTVEGLKDQENEAQSLIENPSQVLEDQLVLDPPLWLDEYNNLNKTAINSFITTYALIEASQTQDSLSNDWVGRQEPIYFEENTSSGSYWFIAADIEGEHEKYYSVLSKGKKFRLTGGVIGPIQASFICRIKDEESDKSFRPSEVNLSEFKVIHPAIVVQLSDGRWRLEQQGVLKFPKVISEV